ncbi:hypothetical protein [Candidatus Venteria ishoeyi]|uniref:Uncharacterized protein n=1 Tax=Candidatus Venteria ishoeyi TaxID=1899563 RepID=A0A1H6F4S7_9GAMM|nr:hypothetical protein [Candidatus Venteria ishoeyi]SEH04563.1 Uncharacterised protein [Candidatus Venteria ishoeyi]
MLQSIEAIVEKNGSVSLLEPIHPARQMRAILTLLEPSEKLPMPAKRSLKSLIGVLKDSTAFDGDPLLVQQAMRDEWD